MGSGEVKPPDPGQPPAPSPPSTSQTSSLLAPGQRSVQVGGSVGSNPAGTGPVQPGGGVTVQVGIPGFNDKHQAQLNLGVTNTGVGVGAQNAITLHQGDTSQQTLLINTQLSMNPKLAAGLGINAEQDWGGDHPQ